MGELNSGGTQTLTLFLPLVVPFLVPSFAEQALLAARFLFSFVRQALVPSSSAAVDRAKEGKTASRQVLLLC